MTNQYTEYNRQYHDEDWLHEQYVQKQRSSTDIADECDTSHSVICNWLDKFDIKRRDQSERASLSHPGPPDKAYTDASWLKEQYQEQQRSAYDIADDCDVTAKTIYDWLDRHGIPRRNETQAQTVLDREAPDKKYTDESWLREKYINQELTLSELADRCDVSIQPIKYWMDEFGIERRNPDPPEHDTSGPEHPCWSGGKADATCDNCGAQFSRWPSEIGKYCSENCKYDGLSPNEPRKYGQGWNNERRKLVRERDNRRCQSCGMRSEQHREKYDSALHVHHIIPAREFDDADKRNATSNLVTLCISCHRRWESVPGLRPTLAD